MTAVRYIEHKVRVESTKRPSLGEMAAAHQLVAELPRIAVRVATFGRGTPLGRRPRWLSEACAFEYLGSTRQGLVRFRAPRLGSVAPKIFDGQQQIFNDAIDPGETAFSLLEKGLADIVRESQESDRYDDVLLSRFSILGHRAFHAGVTHLILDDARRGHDGVTLEPSAVDQARHLLDRTPPSQRVRLAGKITLLRSQGNAFEVTSSEGGVARCALVGAAVETIKDRFETDVAVTGTAVFRPSGHLRRIDVDVVEPATSSDRLFQRLPSASALAAPMTAKHGVKAGKNWLADVVGTWPGPESEAELLKALRESS